MERFSSTLGNTSSSSLSAMPDPGLGGINANAFPFSSISDKMQQFFCIKLCICF